jgi:hypothetical protein
MKKTSRTIGLAPCALSLFLLGGIFLDGADVLTEREKISALLKAIETAEGLQFIRSGTAYDGKTAAAHLRRKLASTGETTLTAEQFIEKIATKSVQTGDPYQIKQSDGTHQASADWMRAELRKIESR